MKTPSYKRDYTELARECYDIALYKGYKFKKSRKLDSWLQYAWSALFKRTMTDFDIQMLKDFLKKRDWIDEKQKLNEIAKDKKYRKFTHKDRFHQKRYIGEDGYIYMNKVMYPLEKQNPKETARLEKLLEQAKEDKLKRFEGYEKRLLKEQARNLWFNNHYYIKNGKAYKK